MNVIALDPRLLALRRLPREALGEGALCVVRRLEEAGGHVAVYRSPAGVSLFVPHSGVRVTFAELRAAFDEWIAA